jgi:hypothetical protein
MSSSSSLMLSQSDLSTIMGRATLVNGFVATTAGVVSNQLVSFTGTFTSPFVASGSLLLLAYAVIRISWGENYGSGGGTSSDGDVFQLGRLSQAWRIVRNGMNPLPPPPVRLFLMRTDASNALDAALLVLGFTQTCFEGSMYLFVFIWVPSLQEAATLNSSEPLSLGYIFSSFMISMMLGSILYTSIVTRFAGSDSGTSGDSSPVLHAKLSSLVCAMSALALGTSIASESEKMRFWAFCVFEACVGMYYPVQGMLRSTFVSNEHRATVRGLFSFFFLPRSADGRFLFFFFRGLAALFPLPRSSQHLRCHLPPHRCDLCTASGAWSQLVHALLFGADDGAGRPSSRRTSTTSPRQYQQANVTVNTF